MPTPAMIHVAMFARLPICGGSTVGSGLSKGGSTLLTNAYVHLASAARYGNPEAFASRRPSTPSLLRVMIPQLLTGQPQSNKPAREPEIAHGRRSPLQDDH